MSNFYIFKQDSNLNGAPTDVVTTMSIEGKNVVREGMAPTTTTPSKLITDPLPIPLTKVDKTDTKINNPYGYGYIKSLDEMRLEDANSIQAKENTIFSLGAIAGVSMIVLSVLIASS